MIKLLGRRRKLVKMFFSQKPAQVSLQQIVLEEEADGIRIKQHIIEVEAKVEVTILTEEEEIIFKVEETTKEEVIFKDKEIIIKVEDNLNIEVKVEAEDNLQEEEET